MEVIGKKLRYALKWCRLNIDDDDDYLIPTQRNGTDLLAETCCLFCLVYQTLLLMYLYSWGPWICIKCIEATSGGTCQLVASGMWFWEFVVPDSGGLRWSFYPLTVGGLWLSRHWSNAISLGVSLFFCGFLSWLWLVNINYTLKYFDLMWLGVKSVQYMTVIHCRIFTVACLNSLWS